MFRGLSNGEMGGGHRNAPGATTRGMSELDSLARRVHRNSMATVETARFARSTNPLNLLIRFGLLSPEDVAMGKTLPPFS